MFKKISLGILTLLFLSPAMLVSQGLKERLAAEAQKIKEEAKKIAATRAAEIGKEVKKEVAGQAAGAVVSAEQKAKAFLVDKPVLKGAAVQAKDFYQDVVKETQKRREASARVSAPAAVAAVAESAAFQKYKDIATKAVQKTVIVSTLSSFVSELEKLTEGKPFVVHEFLGFSGADFADIDGFRNDFKQRILDIVKSTSESFGPDAKTVLLLGGTLDGFGVGYNVIAELREKGEIKNVIVGGLVSDAAVKYPESISPKQDLLLFMNVYKEPGKDEAWELVSQLGGASATVEVLTKIISNPNAKVVSMELYEGGAQALREATEYNINMEGLALEKTKELVLHVGYEPKKVDKAKGIRAASNLAVILSDPLKLKVQLFLTKPGSSSLIKSEEFYPVEENKKLIEREAPVQ